MTESNTSPGAGGAQLYVTPAKLDKWLDKELGKDAIKDVLGDYFDEVKSVVRGLIHDNLGLTRSESAEVMEVDPQT